MISALLAVDAGGSTTRAMLVDREGTLLGKGAGPGANPGSNPPALAVAAIAAAVEAALADAGMGRLRLDLAYLALAGPHQRLAESGLDVALERLGLAGPLHLIGDLQALLAAVNPAGTGYCVVCGTGAGAARLVENVVVCVADTAGWLLGDTGSGYWLGHAALRAVTADIQGRGEPTALTAAILADLGIPAEERPRRDGRPQALRQLIDAVYNLRPIELARFARVVIATRADPLAARLLAEAEDNLFEDFRLVFSADHPGPVVLGGGVIAHLPGLPGRIADLIRTAGHAPDVTLVRDGSAGAVALALRAAGVQVDRAMVARIAAAVARSSP